MIIMLVSFFLDGVFSNLLKSPLLPLFAIVAIVVMEKYYSGNEKKYLGYCFITGLLYDLVYTNSLFINAFIFLLIGFITIVFYYFLTHRLDMDILVAVASIIIYRIINFIVNALFHEVSSDQLLPSIYNSIIINVIYCIIIYLIAKKTYKFTK